MSTTKTKPLSQLKRSTANAEKIRDWVSGRQIELEEIEGALAEAEAAMESGSGCSATERDEAWDALQNALDEAGQ